MASWTNDSRLHTLMRTYLTAVARLDLARERLRTGTVPGAFASEKMLRDQHDVGSAIAERRQHDVHTADAVVEIFAETAFFDRSLEFAVRGTDDAHVGRAIRGLADTAELPVLQKTKQLGLNRQRHLADLIEKHRAAVRCLDHAGAIPIRARECTAHVTEQFALDEVFRKRSTVDGRECPVAPR